MSIEAMKLALEALEPRPGMPNPEYESLVNCAITALRRAIAEAQQAKPVAYAVYHRMGGGKSLHWPEQHSPDGDATKYRLVPLVPAPPQRQPVTEGLCEECEMKYCECGGHDEHRSNEAGA